MKAKYILTAIFFLSYSAGAQTATQTANYHQGMGNESATAAPGITLRLYPVVAKNYTNIYVKADKPAPFKVAIYDSYNTLIKQWDEHANGNYEKNIDVTKMANGKYYVKVTFAGGSLRQSFTVAH